MTPACAPGLPSVPPQSSQSWPISSSPILFHRCNSAPRANTTSAVPCLPLRGHDTHPDPFPQISIGLFTTWVHLLFLFIQDFTATRRSQVRRGQTRTRTRAHLSESSPFRCGMTSSRDRQREIPRVPAYQPPEPMPAPCEPSMLGLGLRDQHHHGCARASSTMGFA